MKKIIIILFISSIIFLNYKKTNNIIIPNKSIRFRIIANSNNKKDQELKLQIKDDIINNYIKQLNNNSYNNMNNSINDNYNILDNILKKYNIEYNISYDNNYFPSKTYKGINYKEGNYKSLVITLGKGIGDNWWCVLFPPLCLLEAEENNYDKVEYQMYIKKIIDKL